MTFITITAFKVAFICNADSTFLDGNYAAFGHVISGMEVVDKITNDVGSDDEMELVEEDKRPVIESIRELVLAEEE
jgi:peptidyl-prolyl cis-trans isomerase B (cyclophilin B)